jgi:MFS family permease
MHEEVNPLKIRNFKFFVVARICFILAMQMVIFSMAWYIYELTNNKLSIGLLGLSEIVPAIILSLYAGHIIDKSDKRSMLQRTMSLYLITAILLGLLCTSQARSSLGVTGVEIGIYGIYFCTGILRSFTGPTMSSIVAQLVPKIALPKAITLSTTAWQTAAVTGPVLAGILIAKTGIETAFVLAAILISVSVTMMTLIPKLAPANTNKDVKAWASVKEGLAYVFRTKELLGAMSVDMFAVFFGGAVAMLPVYAKDILHIDAQWMGWLKAAQSIGTILALTTLSRYPLKGKQGRIMLQCVAMFGLCILVFAVSKNYWLSFSVLFFSGIFDAISMLVRSTILQMYVPDDMRGRVSSVGSMFVNSSNELGEFESGVSARFMGTVPSVLFGGCMTILVVAVAWVKAPKLRKLEY